MIVGSRESQLAMLQTEEFIRRLKKKMPEIECETRGITSSGDIDLKTSLKDMGGTGVFVRELDDLLKKGEIDVTVNSLKDIPAFIDEELTIGAVLPRAAVEDALYPIPWEKLSCGAIVGTSSMRRAMMIRARKPDIRIKDIRGNMNTRLQKVNDEVYNAIVVAKAAMDRMGEDLNVYPIDKNIVIPAAGQGAIAVECRKDDKETLEILKKVDHAKTRIEVTFERDVLRYMNAGCSSPIGVNAEVTEDDEIKVLAASFVPDVPVRLSETFPVDDAPEKAKEIAAKLMRK
ncbi:porphobilinogen deaminase [Thermoplasmatales archaeon BRNA1]|nr:porphobilinogen deaminase [Thermoplasmatales archaeon BRNA1]